MTERTIVISYDCTAVIERDFVRRKLHELPQARRLALAVGSALLILTGCANVEEQMERWFVARKDETLIGWEAIAIDGKPMLATLGLRVAWVEAGIESSSAQADDSGFSYRTFTQAGTAVPISDDGYFLTAAHVVEGTENLTVRFLREQEGSFPEFECSPARVVWEMNSIAWKNVNPYSSEPVLGMDLSILHAEMSSLPQFTIADNAPRIGEPVIGAGWGVDPSRARDVGDGASLAAGKVLSVTSQEARGLAPAFVAVQHDIPFVSGDSGGPLIDRNGHLIGINFGGGFRLSFWQSVAIIVGRRPNVSEDYKHSAMALMPDPDWLWNIIENDRRRRTAASASRHTQHPCSQD